ncbi:MAG TPA: hypothetical protein VHK47_03990 [Polyangia bacterium]|jgi:hypothetical protein|nr:hypothetical protein [Polyangia bacterium]
MAGIGELARGGSPAARRAAVAAVVVVAAIIVIVGARRPAALRAIAAVTSRWREMHTPGGGRDRIVPAQTRAFVDLMRSAGISHYRFTPKLGDDIEFAPFILEASWPIEVREQDEIVAGYTSEFAARKDCTVVGVAGKYTLARCHL